MKTIKILVAILLGIVFAGAAVERYDARVLHNLRWWQTAAEDVYAHEVVIEEPYAQVLVGGTTLSNDVKMVVIDANSVDYNNSMDGDTLWVMDVTLRGCLFADTAQWTIYMGIVAAGDTGGSTVNWFFVQKFYGSGCMTFSYPGIKTGELNETLIDADDSDFALETPIYTIKLTATTTEVGDVVAWIKENSAQSSTFWGLVNIKYVLY